MLKLEALQSPLGHGNIWTKCHVVVYNINQHLPQWQGLREVHHSRNKSSNSNTNIPLRSKTKQDQTGSTKFPKQVSKSLRCSLATAFWIGQVSHVGGKRQYSEVLFLPCQLSKQLHCLFQVYVSDLWISPQPSLTGPGSGSGLFWLLACSSHSMCKGINMNIYNIPIPTQRALFAKIRQGMLFHVIPFCSDSVPSHQVVRVCFFGTSECAPDVCGISHQSDPWVVFCLLNPLPQTLDWLRLAAFVNVDGKVLGRLFSAALPPSLSLCLSFCLSPLRLL